MKRIVAGIVVAALAGVAVYGFLLTQRERTYHEWVSRGDVALARDDTYAAIEAFSVAISWKRDSMAAHLKRGEAYRRRSEYDAARRDLRTAAEIDPGSPHPHELLGDVHYAMAAGEKGYAPARFARAVEHYQKAIELDDSSARVQYKLGLAAYRTGQLPAALQALRDAIRLDERFVEAHYLLGVCLRAGGQLRESIHELERAAALDRTFFAAREELAQTYRATGRTREQLETLEALAVLDPSPARTRAVGLAYARAGQLDRGIAYLGRAAQLNPADRDTFLALGRLWLDRVAGGGEIELGKALNALAEAIDSNSGSAARAIYGRALLMAGQTARAETVLRDATTRFPIEPDAFLHLADAAERLARRDESREALIAYAALTLLDELRPDVLVRIAEAHAETGNPADARRAVDAALAKDPHSPRARALRARLESSSTRPR